MRNELNALVNSVSDPQMKRVRYINLFRYISMMLMCYQAFDTEMQTFFFLFTRYLVERAHSRELCVLSTLASGSNRLDYY